MILVYNPTSAASKSELDLSGVYSQETILEILLPNNSNYLVIDKENTLISFEYKPIESCGYYHPQPGTDFKVIGQFLDNNQEQLPLLNASILLDSTIN